VAENGHEMGLDDENEPRRVWEGGDDENGRVDWALGTFLNLFFSTFFITNNHSFTFLGFTYENNGGKWARDG
jgi:hypothetical protein